MLKVCCCFTLKTGAIVTGALSVIFSLISFIGGIYDWTRNEQAEDVWVKIVGTLLAIFNVIASILLLVGSAKEKKWWLLPWLIYDCIALILTIIIVLFIIVVINWGAVFVLPIIAIWWFLWVVVLSYYWELRRRDEGGNSYSMNKPQQGATTISYPQQSA